jgi:hypothetical protein
VAQLDQNLRAIAEGPLPAEALPAVDGAWRKLRGPFPQYNR